MEKLVRTLSVACFLGLGIQNLALAEEPDAMIRQPDRLEAAFAKSLREKNVDVGQCSEYAKEFSWFGGLTIKCQHTHARPSIECAGGDCVEEDGIVTDTLLTVHIPEQYLQEQGFAIVWEDGGASLPFHIHESKVLVDLRAYKGSSPGIRSGDQFLVKDSALQTALDRVLRERKKLNDARLVREAQERLAKLRKKREAMAANLNEQMDKLLKGQ